MSLHFPCFVADFPPCLSLNFLCTGLTLPPSSTCSSCRFLRCVTSYLSLPVSFFSVSGPCLVNLEVSLCPSHPYPPSMDKHIGHVGPSVKGAAVSVPLPPPRSGQCNTQMDEFPVHPPLAGSPGGEDKCEKPKLETKLTFTSP